MSSKEILILDGDSRADGTALRDRVEQLAESLRSSGHQVTHLALRELDLGTCTGCWHCWTKTPGLCSQRDDIERIYRAYLEADVVVFASPLVMGFASALTKRVLDRLIPLGHPNIELVDGECTHLRRYERYPRLACLLERGAQDDDEDVALNQDYFRRTAHHFRTELCFTALCTTPFQEVHDALDAA